MPSHLGLLGYGQNGGLKYMKCGGSGGLQQHGCGGTGWFGTKYGWHTLIQWFAGIIAFLYSGTAPV